VSARRFVPLALVAVAVAVVAGAWSWGGRTVTVTHATLGGTLVDNGASGASVGDVRIFEIATVVRGSATPGRMDAVMTTTGADVPDPGSEIRTAQLIFTFRDGKDQIVVAGVSTYPASGSTIATAFHLER